MNGKKANMKLLVDTHSHTIVSGHAYSTIREMAQMAYHNGLEALAITEHAPQMPFTCGEYYFQNLKVVPRQMCNIQLLLGVELNIMDENGSVDMEESLLKQMDIAVASIHGPCLPLNLGMEVNTNAYINAMKNPYINIIGHPDDNRYPINYERLVLAAKENQVLLEVNNSSLCPISFRQNAKGNIQEMLKWCKKYEVPITVGSDAHVDVDAGRFTEALEVLKMCDFPETLVVTTSLEKLKPYINRFKNE